VQELKVDGVSNYLHMVNDTHIIGLGAAAGANGGLGGGLQLSLFDVTDVKRPLLSASKVFGTSSSSSLATTDHKAFLYHPASGIIAVPVTTWDYSGAGGSFDGAMVFSLSGQGFLHKLSLSHARPGGNSWAGPQSVKRSRYISGVLWSFSDREIQGHLVETMGLAARLNATVPNCSNLETSYYGVPYYYGTGGGTVSAAASGPKKSG